MTAPKKKRRLRPGNSDALLPGNFGSRDGGSRRPTVGRTRLPTAKSAGCIRPDPAKEQLEAAIAEGRCWWCGATHGVNGQEIVAWSAHWSKAHGILVAQVRLILEVGKRRTFVSDEMRAKMRARIAGDPRFEEGRRKKNKKKPVHPDWVSRHQTERIQRVNASLTTAQRVQNARRSARARRSRMRPCVICDRKFWSKGGYQPGKRRTTCSPACSEKLRPHQRALDRRDIRWGSKARAAAFTQRAVADHLGVNRKTVRTWVG